MPHSPEGQPEGPYLRFKDSVVLGISALTLFSTTFQFYIREYLAPPPTALQISAGLESAGERDGLSLVRVAVRATNPSERRVHVPAIWFSVLGYGVPPEPCDARPDWQNALTSGNEQLQSSFNVPSGDNIVAQRRVFVDGSAWYEPKDVTNFEDIVVVPSGRFDFLKLIVQYIQARSVKDLEEMPIQWTAEPQGRWVADPRFKKSGPHEWAKDEGGGLNFFESVLALARPGVPLAGAKRDTTVPLVHLNRCPRPP